MTEKRGPLPPFRRETRRLRPYRVPIPPHVIKLNQNESAVELPLFLKRRIAARLAGAAWSRYPDFPPERLTKRIAEAAGVPARAVLVGHGSNELLYAAAQTTIERGSTMVIPTPSYRVAHLAARLAGGRARAVPLGERFAFDAGRFVAAIRKEKPRLVFIASPNNPTGGALTYEEVDRIAGAGRSLVLVDEAYREFSTVCLTPLLEKHRNLVLLRTFSKAGRLAGLRIGYLLGNPEVLEVIERGKPPHTVDLFAQIAAEAILDEGARIEREVRRTVKERRRVAALLEGLPGVEVFPSAANFLLVRFPDGEEAYGRLLARGVLVRFVGRGAGGPAGRDRIPVDRRLRHCLRITIGTRAENDLLLAVLARRRKGER